jgi:hypothetical protein
MAVPTQPQPKEDLAESRPPNERAQQGPPNEPLTPFSRNGNEESEVTSNIGHAEAQPDHGGGAGDDGVT